MQSRHHTSVNMKYSIILGSVVAITNVNALTFGDVSNALSSSVDVLKRARDAIPSLVGRKDGSSGSGSSGSGGGGSCPAVWSQVVPDLTALFLDKSTGQCNDAARAAIRVRLILSSISKHTNRSKGSIPRLWYLGSVSRSNRRMRWLSDSRQRSLQPP